jgi:hypothetical protein
VNQSKHGLMSIAALALGCLMMQTVCADDSMSRATPTKKQMMKDCIRKHETADVNLSKPELNRICKDELKQDKLTGSPPPPAAPNDGPQQPQQ